MFCYQPESSVSNNDAYIFFIVCKSPAPKLNESAIPSRCLRSSEKEIYVCTDVDNKVFLQ